MADLKLSILETEVSTLVTAMRRSQVWSRTDSTLINPTLLSPFLALKSNLNSSEAFELEPKVFLTPFLDVIRSESVTGQVTGLALDSVHKFLTYDLLNPDMKDATDAVENLADAVTHARYIVKRSKRFMICYYYVCFVFP